MATPGIRIEQVKQEKLHVRLKRGEGPGGTDYFTVLNLIRKKIIYDKLLEKNMKVHLE